MLLYTKEELVEKLKQIRNQGWIKNARTGNAGGVGNTLEDLLGIEENNLPIPNAAEWELKTAADQYFCTYHTFSFRAIAPRSKNGTSDSFATVRLGAPRSRRKISSDEKSFRQTIHALTRSDRGFGVIVNREERKVEISFDVKCVASHHSDWLASVDQRINLTNLSPNPTGVLMI